MKKIFLMVALFATSCVTTPGTMKQSWRITFKETLPLLGHRNWILIVDKAFPLQTAPGVEVIYTGEKLSSVVSFVTEAVSKADHVKGIYYVDRELEYMTDDLAKGVSDYRKALFSRIAQATPVTHEDVFKMIDEASSLFKVLVLKTDGLIPYSSVYIHLDCNYWNEEKETVLRGNMK